MPMSQSRYSSQSAPAINRHKPARKDRSFNLNAVVNGRKRVMQAVWQAAGSLSELQVLFIHPASTA